MEGILLSLRLGFWASMEEKDIYAKDGTTDFHYKLAIKKETGTWKACPYILGTLSLLQP